MECAGKWEFGAGFFFSVILQTFVQSKTFKVEKPKELKPRVKQGILGLTFPMEAESGNCPAVAQDLFKTCELIWLTLFSISFHTRFHLNQEQSRGIYSSFLIYLLVLKHIIILFVLAFSTCKAHMKIHRVLGRFSLFHISLIPWEQYFVVPVFILPSLVLMCFCRELWAAIQCRLDLILGRIMQTPFSCLPSKVWVALTSPTKQSGNQHGDKSGGIKRGGMIKVPFFFLRTKLFYTLPQTPAW